MSFIKIYVHTVWTTKDRYPYLIKDHKSKIINHILENARIKNIHIDHINGFTEHLHAIISMNADQNIAEILNLIKGESSFWINKEELFKSRFAWQNDYFAVSIGESQLEAVREYIRNQEKHHHSVTFQQEYDQFMKVYGFNKKPAIIS